MVNAFEKHELKVAMSAVPCGRREETWTQYLVTVWVQFGRKWQIRLESVRLDIAFNDPDVVTLPNWTTATDSIMRSVVEQLCWIQHNRLLEQWGKAGLRQGFRDADTVLFYKDRALRLTNRPPLDKSPSVQVRTLTGTVLQEVLCTDLDKPLELMSNCFTVIFDDIKITLTTRGQVVNIDEVAYE